ncbi:MAG: hypothetical protein FVQ85_09320 [Planctomycetes bacterium]|nr:hypothetical protein [Planctomycetota bacterium]
MKRLLANCVVTALVLIMSATANAATWDVPGDFSTIQEAIDSPSVLPGATILVGPGNHFGALVDKEVEIKGEGGAVINDGPPHGHPNIDNQGFRLLAGSDGATISHLDFTVDLAIMNGEAINDVTVDHCTFTNAVQAVSNWRGSGWQISHNVITDLRTICGGGIGILIADFSGGVVENNVVSHNKITGTLHVDPDDCGGYSGTGIVLYADFRWGGAGAKEIKNNRVVKNKVSLVSDNAELVDVVAFELTDTRDTTADVVFDNAIGFNDFRGTTNQISLTPTILDEVNAISRNLGNNRGHGLHPGAFGPGGN